MERVKVSIIIYSIGILAFGSIVGCEEEKANTAPVINSFQADPTSVEPNGHITLTVSALDAEGDSLTYRYQSGGGTITGTGDTVTWIAPKTTGSYDINVEVSDGELSTQSTVTVECEDKPNTVPIINSFRGDSTSVEPNGQVTLTVSAVDAEGDSLTYAYHLVGGTITGTGDTVTWIAPETAGNYVINVEVNDGKGSAQSAVMITVAAAQQENHAELKIQWIGHSCFLITSSDGKRVLTDPFGASVGYPVPSIETDVVLVTHSHSDHNNVSMAKGSPEIVRTQGENTAAGISFLGVMSDHDDAGGAKRGKNIIFVWEMGGMRLAHLGDLGQLKLRDDQVAEMGKVDILFIPVGGTYTIDAEQATKVVEQLSPKLVFPMHYKTDVVNLPIASVEGFLAGKDSVEKVNKNSVVVEELPAEMKVIVLDYR